MNDSVSAIFDALNAKLADLVSDATTKNKLGQATLKDAIAFQIASDINQWLHEKGDDITKYQIFLNRVMDLKDVAKLAMDKTKTQLSDWR